MCAFAFAMEAPQRKEAMLLKKISERAKAKQHVQVNIKAGQIGPKGPQGFKGYTGAQGFRGPRGYPGAYEIGVHMDSNDHIWSLRKSLDSDRTDIVTAFLGLWDGDAHPSMAVLFAGARGPRGPRGIQGPKGIQVRERLLEW
jgi:hypothetical protein